ncbi:MAG: MutS-related protein [Acidimicrobiales bacterium]
MKAYLLYEDRDFDLQAELPPNHEDLVQDLELTTLLQAMAGGDTLLLDVARRVLLAGTDDPAAILYRQQILVDCLAEPEVIREMHSIAVAAMEDKRGLWGYSSRSPSSILSGALNQLQASVARLRQVRKVADAHAGRLRSAGLVRLLRSLQSELDDEYLERVEQHLRQLRFRDGEVISAELDRDNSGTGFVLRSPGDGGRGWKERLGIGPRSSYSFTVAPRDDAGLQALGDISGRGLNLVANAAAQSADHILSWFGMLRAELGFYVGCLNLRERLAEAGQAITLPEPLPAQPARLRFGGLCDASLALRAAGPVVGNDVDADGRSLLLVTGASSGGKSTFLRSVGQAQLMMGCGMFVAAQSYRASVCGGVFTHFTREEDAAMTSGRLDEELSRMSALAEQISPRCLVLFNESFAATNEREGSEIGRQVVSALLEAGVRVVFVTHQLDLAESFLGRRPEPALFLRADRRPDGGRTYKLAVADPLPTSFGEDLYHRLGGWMGGGVGTT